MHENNYQRIINRIHVPGGLNERVLAAVGREVSEKKQKTRQPVWRAAACAVLALVLVLGGVCLRPGEAAVSPDPDQEERFGVTYTFGLTAYAADERMVGNGNLLLGSESGVKIKSTELVPEREQYTGYCFQIRGENIQTLTLSMDRGGLYRVRGGQSLISTLPNPAQEEFDADAVYGLWVPPQEWIQGRGSAILDGAELTVTAHFADGSERTNTYRMAWQQLLVSENEDGTEVLVPALEGSDQTGVSGLYLESLNSVWFCWPVEGANTVSLSNRYGYRVAPGGQGGTFHAGIDIPAEQGAPVLAAADGTVTESGFDVAKGNYLVLGHGNGMETVYAHCLCIGVEAGDKVAAGQEIAAVGSTGMSTGPHLHFEVRQDGEAQNPVAFFDAEIRNTLKMG